MKKPSRTQWGRTEATKDGEIDYSDNPKLDVSFLERAVRWRSQELISLRLDREVLAFFRKQGKGYQTTINTLVQVHGSSGAAD